MTQLDKIFKKSVFILNITYSDQNNAFIWQPTTQLSEAWN